jgi:undecaprenyl-diphosphatase
MPGRRSLSAAAVSGSLFAVLTVLVAQRTRPLLRFDSAISSAAWRLAVEHAWWRSLAVAVTNSGGPAVVTVASVAAVLILLAVGRRREAVFVTATMLGSTGIRLIVLNMVGRVRPADRLAPAAGFSFPSGHTTESAAAALTAIAVLWPLLRGRRRIVVLAAVLWAMAVGLSRVALVVHWPTDVLGGWLLAATVVAAALPVLARSRHSEPGASHRDELGGGDGRGRAEGDDYGEEAGEPAVTGLRGRAGQGLHTTDDDAASDAE